MGKGAECRLRAFGKGKHVTAPMSKAPPLCLLQRLLCALAGHVDMVTEKNSGSNHDFFKDPIKLLVEEDWLTADGTTLGADNGIGVAAALTLLDRKFSPRSKPWKRYSGRY